VVDVLHHRRLDAGDEAGTLEHQARVELQQRGAGLDLGDRRGAGVDAADADQRDAATGQPIDARQHDGGAEKQGRAGHPARFPRQRVALFYVLRPYVSSLRFGKRSLRHNGVQFDQAKCVTVRGNSMLPVLRDGATVGVNAGKCGIGDIVDGDLYAINHNGQLRVKQLYRLPTGIRLRSFNRDEHPDEDYTFQDIQEEPIVILGHVFWWGMYAR